MALAQEFADLAYASAGAVRRLLDQYREAIGSPDPVIIKIRPYLDDADPAVRRAAAYALGQMHDGPSLPRIVALLKDSELWVRDAASLALALFQEDAVAPVASAMREADASFKIIGLDLLGRIKGDRAKAHIRSFLSDANMHVRRAARQALSRF
jgi:HEAT repeat protein